jgi:hypothetical protein
MATDMTDPHDDLSTVADPASMGPEAVTPPAGGEPGDLDRDNERLADEAGTRAPDVPVVSPPAAGIPPGPPD